jgi:hypothetical protein
MFLSFIFHFQRQVDSLGQPQPLIYRDMQDEQDKTSKAKDFKALFCLFYHPEYPVHPC